MLNEIEDIKNIKDNPIDTKDKDKDKESAK